MGINFRGGIKRGREVARCIINFEKFIELLHVQMVQMVVFEMVVKHFSAQEMDNVYYDGLSLSRKQYENRNEK